MRKPSLGIFLPLCALIAVACKGDSVGVEPQLQNQRVLTTSQIFPGKTDLFPEFTRQLRIEAQDQFGSTIQADKITFSSSAPEIAEVSNSGLVTARSPGTVEITATLAHRGVTRAERMVTEVWERDTFSGVFELTAPISAPTGQGYLDDRYTAILRLQQDPTDPSQLKGTYESLQLLGPDGEALSPASIPATNGLVHGLIEPGGKVHIVLYAAGIEYGWDPYTWYLRGVLASEKIVGGWQCCSPEFSGSFTAVRR